MTFKKPYYLFIVALWGATLVLNAAMKNPAACIACVGAMAANFIIAMGQ